MKHFLNLDRCTCGAYRYLAVREHKRSYEVYLIHHLHSQDSQDSRKYAKLASIPKYKLNMHDERMNEFTEERRIRITFEQSLALKSLLKELETNKREVNLNGIDAATEGILTEEEPLPA